MSPGQIPCIEYTVLDIRNNFPGLDVGSLQGLGVTLEIVVPKAQMGALRKGEREAICAQAEIGKEALETLQVVLEEPSKVGKTSDRDLGCSQKFSCVSILLLF